MKFKILSWNVRGVNDPDKRKVIKNFLEATRRTLLVYKKQRFKRRRSIWCVAWGWVVN